MANNKTSEYPFFLISKKETLEKISELIKEYSLGEYSEENVFLQLGYKNLSSADKQTYSLLRGIAKINLKNKQIGSAMCKVSLDYIAVALGTSEDCQSARIKKLQQCGLVKIIRRAYCNNSYQILEPMPDASFCRTIVRLNRRKNLGLLLSRIKSIKDPGERVDCLLQITKLVERNTTHYNLKNVISNTTTPQEQEEINKALENRKKFKIC
jgi:hypothetical protein